MSAVVPPELRSTAFAMTTFIESGFAAVVALVFGLIADKIDLHTAMIWTIPFPWIICAILFSGFYLTYPKDLEKNQCLLIMHIVNDRGVICANQYQLLCPDERSGPGPGGYTIIPEGKTFTPEGKEITVDGKQLTVEGKQFSPNLSKRTYPRNSSTEGNGSCKNKIPRAFASLGIDPAEFTGLSGREATE